jgi:hypothetical protein
LKIGKVEQDHVEEIIDVDKICLNLNRPERKFGEVLKKRQRHNFAGTEKDCNESEKLKLRNWSRKKRYDNQKM